MIFHADRVIRNIFSGLAISYRRRSLANCFLLLSLMSYQCFRMRHGQDFTWASKAFNKKVDVFPLAKVATFVDLGSEVSLRRRVGQEGRAPD